MLNVVCIRAGEAFSPAYVTILHDMVRRNLSVGFPGRFICFSDQPDDYGKGIEVRPLPAPLPGWWSKLALFRPGLFPKDERVLFFDLDTLITGPIDDLASYTGNFAILQDFYRPGGLQSAVMAWYAGECHDIWASYEAAGCPTDVEGGDQAWIERLYLDGAMRLQGAFPGLFASYKQLKGPPGTASVVCFHGRPRPHEVDGWASEVWKMNGMTRGELLAVCNTAREALLANVDKACARDLPWFDFEPGMPVHDGHAVIVGGGPSLVETVDEIRWRQGLGQHVWALNNSCRWLINRGIRPDVQVILDARPENAAFIDNAGKYYIASQCDPAVFAAVGKRPTVLWHANTEGMMERLDEYKDKPVHLIGGGNSVGLNAIVLAYLQGYRKIHLYGFDSCYRDDMHHAYDQHLNDGVKVVDALFNERKYRCAPWMVGQANEYVDLARELTKEGCTITVHGDGLLQDMARDMQRFPVITPAEIRAHEVLKRLNGALEPQGVEIGVFAGDMSRALLEGNPALHLTMVDSWEGNGAAYRGKCGDWHDGLDDEEQDDYRRTAMRRTAFAEDRRTVLHCRSVKAAHKLHDGFYDFVFIDADHSYEGVKSDIAALHPCVKPGGWLCGHDYDNPDFPLFGVRRAVDEYAAATGATVELGDNFTWFIKKG